jgi:hypothetical protein
MEYWSTGATLRHSMTPTLRDPATNSVAMYKSLSVPTRRSSSSALRHRVERRDLPNRQQLVELEVQANTEHEQHDPNVGQLFGDISAGHH